MDRRNFLKSLFVVGMATAIDIDKAIEQTLIDCVKMSDMDFITYMTMSINMYVRNPAQCVVITNIAGDE